MITLSRFSLAGTVAGADSTTAHSLAALGAMDSEEESILGRGMSPTVSWFASLSKDAVSLQGIKPLQSNVIG